MRKHILSIFLFFLSGFVLSGQVSGYIEQGNITGEIKSARIHREEWNLSYPVIDLNSNDKLLLHFDLLDDKTETFYYTFIHCDKDWNQSQIFDTDYLDGFSENRIENYELSFNTTVNYIHYSVTFPNEYVSFKISGNYLVKVYPYGDTDNPVLVKRFMISENNSHISATPMRSKLADSYLTGQQIDFIIDHSSMELQNPYNNIFCSLLQNGRWDNARMNLTADFTGNFTLEYNDLSANNIFPGGSEFRYFDIKSLRYLSEYVKNIEHRYGYGHVNLYPSKSRGSRQYFYNQDFNGKYYIAHQEGVDPNSDADYVWVYFTLPSNFPVLNGDVYIFGELSRWEFNSDNRMFYNPETHTYEGSLLLKQGWYNFLYVVKSGDGSVASLAEFEGNHYETENDYLILCYYRDPMERYDRLIGHKVVNTIYR